MSYTTNANNFLVPSNIAELSTYGFCNWLDHHIFRDTRLSPTGYNFFYPLTAYGGPLSGGPTGAPVTFDSSVSGGPLYDICYQDFCYKTINLGNINLYCVSTVNFVLTALDETVSDIIKIIYDFGDGSKILVNNYNFTDASAPSPKNIIVSHEYYPTERTITSYIASLSVLYNNCCLNTYKATLCTFRCGIIDLYEDVRLLDSTQSKDSFNIVLTMENLGQRQVFDTLLDLNEPLPILSALPNTIQLVPLEQSITDTAAITAQRARRNPVRPPMPYFIYIEGVGIDMNPDKPQLELNEEFIPVLGIVLSGDQIGAPYLGGPGITIRA